MITKDFLTAGRAIFTVSNDKGEHYTYKVTAPADLNEMYPTYFVALLTGPNNQRDYTYLGILAGITGHVRTTAKSKFDKDSKPVKVVQWAVQKVYEGGKLPEGYAIQHEGHCGACGRPLTDPVSIETGLGPICAGREAEGKKTKVAKRTFGLSAPAPSHEDVTGFPAHCSKD